MIYSNNISSTHYRLIWFLLTLFAISLPFNGIEFYLFPVNRFELKVTMVTFLPLFITCLFRPFNLQLKNNFKKIFLFYIFTFIYGISQFASSINSPMPFESIKQGIIIVLLLVVMIAISESILDKKIAASIMTTIGMVSLIIGIIGIVYYFFFTDYSSRLGNNNGDIGIISLGGDAAYLGDMLLYSIGSVFFVVFKLSGRAYWKWIGWSLLILWFSAVVATYTKGLIISVISFLMCLFFILKEKRTFIVVSLILFITTIIFVPRIPKIVSSVSKYIAINSEWENHNQHNPLRIYDFSSQINIFSTDGLNSVWIRMKAYVVSLNNSTKHFWFGNGAGLSQKLLPEMANDYDRIVNEKTKRFMEKHFIYGESANRSLIDSHSLFLTEFFNVGIIGAISLICLIVFVVREQIRALKITSSDRDNTNELLFATLIAMLIFRFTGSFVVIPFLWFILGLSFGVCTKILEVDPKTRTVI